MTEYTQQQLLEIWKATTRPVNALRDALEGPGDAYDQLDNLVKFSHYGNAQSGYGWEVDHHHPSALGGTNAFSNLRALSCRANRRLGGLLGAGLRGR